MKKLELQFKNEEDRTVTLSLDNPIEPVDPVAVNAAMDNILQQDVFTSASGDLVSKHAARVVERTVTEVEIGV